MSAPRVCPSMKTLSIPNAIQTRTRTTNPNPILRRYHYMHFGQPDLRLQDAKSPPLFVRSLKMLMGKNQHNSPRHDQSRDCQKQSRTASTQVYCDPNANPNKSKPEIAEL